MHSAQEDDDDPPRKRRRHDSVSYSSCEETVQVSTVHPSEDTQLVAPVDEEEHSLQPNELNDGSTEIALPEPESGLSVPEEATQESSYDIFGDLVDETILAGNIFTAERSSPARRTLLLPILCVLVL